jgi:DNA-binding response OmpR family regulator
MNPMWSDRTAETGCQLHSVVLDVERQPARRRCIEQIAVGPWSYLAKRGRVTIRLNVVEYRILKLLASRPYHVFSARRIADAVSTPSRRVSADSLRLHVASLRSQLGFFSDYIQRVPHMGYRFKA